LEGFEGDFDALDKNAFTRDLQSVREQRTNVARIFGHLDALLP
jgi:hypothetical protein